MTQTASISSLNKKAFLKRAFKGFSNPKTEIRDSENTPPLPSPKAHENNTSES
ncbi:hypothetical protein [Maridesulfovibrio hydrothermalis]|uniref:hypothetical protein n=1 Tax=Maridesulfovibrio hydrothermalis TaxID=191026 RepID=UPI0002EBDDDD|nr:hypothetical protein [Maridesulfovibrio hydrothermalis]